MFLKSAKVRIFPNWRLIHICCLSLLIVIPSMGQDECARKHTECDDSTIEVTYIDHIPKDGITKKVDPVFSDETNEKIESGTAVVSVVIDEKGRIIRVCFLKGQAVIKQAVLEAVKQWEFKPRFGMKSKFPTKYIGTRIVFRIVRSDDT